MIPALATEEPTAFRAAAIRSCAYDISQRALVTFTSIFCVHTLKLNKFSYEKELDMNQAAFHTSAPALDSHDFNHNYRYIKKLIQALMAQNRGSLKRDMLSGNERIPHLTNKEMLDLARVLRKIELEYAEYCKPPIPKALETSIRRRNDADWLPWEMEAIEKIDVWREGLETKKEKIQQMLNKALTKINGKGVLQ
jgi:hypothetical protein